MDIDTVLSFFSTLSKELQTIAINPSELIFEERVRLSCFNCTRYGVTHTCPPNIPKIDYKKALAEYENGVLVIHKLSSGLDVHNRRESTLEVHRALLGAEKLLWDNNYPLAMSFIGGSCKLCAKGCSKEGCQQPLLSRIPLEAIGVNVIEVCRQLDISISFPPKDELYRVGLLLW